MLAGAMALGSSLTACVDDFKLEEGPNSDIYAVNENEYAMGVVLSLDQLSGVSTRGQIGGPLGNLAGGSGQGLKDIEEYVNTENLYILFFNLDGTFLFQINKPVAIPIGQSEFGNDSQWFIRIPVKDINENLIHYIEENPFKIAVLANWTFDSDINLGSNLSGWDEFKFKEPLDAEGNLVYDEFGKLQGDHISLLAHAQRDNVYENTTMHGYDHLVHRTETGSHMGPYTEWVANYHRNIPEAETHIRTYFNVEENYYQNPDNFFYDENGVPTALDHFNTKYNNLWHVWYFNGTYDGEGMKNFTIEAGNTQMNKWIELNQGAKEAMFAPTNVHGESFSYESDHTWKLGHGYSDLYLSKGVQPNYWDTKPQLVDQDGYDVPGEELKFSGMAITEANLSKDYNDTGNPLNLDNNHQYMSFTAKADGYVRINFEAQGGAKLYAHVGTNNTPQNNASGYQKDNRDSRFEIDPSTGTFTTGEIADIPFDPKPIYLYMVVDEDYVPVPPMLEDGNDVPSPEKPMITIHSIEYIESRHLYDVDRRAILPSKDYAIPMYGVQDFDPIGEYWEPGVLFNLSQFNNAQKLGYNYRRISLLRSISRVEVKLKKSDFPQKPSHVYLRSMNRSSRITPVDFFTPTDIIWNGFNPSSPDDVRRLQNYIDVGNLNEQQIIQTTPGVAQEEKNIMQYGPIYIGSGANNGESNEQKLTEYRRTTAWPFGIWEKQWDWNWNRGNGLVEDFETYQVGQSRRYTGQTVPEYPRILHTRISRSDYSHFAEVEDPEYWHYIMYIPEKNITDADNPGNISDRPKIVHVEIRFNGGPENTWNNDDPENIVDNFDDNLAYRLYFTQGGRANLGGFEWNGRESWDKYEYDLDIVKQHWPILRNHEYIFTVTGGLGNSGNINLQVSAPEQRFVGWTFY